mmetsp:Transcript_11789/g.36411  ORF Transcript_11789/g.36411 Transcript_11789/m.36411 type:complete len:345 (-) Transcript_11789:12-1046(-)
MQRCSAKVGAPYTGASLHASEFSGGTASARLTALRSHVHHARLAALILGDLLRHHALPAILVGLRDLLFEVDNGLGGVEALGAAISAVHDAMAAVELHGVVHPSQPLLRELIPGVRNPAVGLHEHCRAQVVLWVPPVGGARGHAASAEDALIHAVELCAVVPALVVLLVALLLHVLPLQPGLDGLVLVVEVREVGHEVLDHVGVGQGLDLDGLLAGLDVEQAREAVLAVDVHGARTADALAARSAEGQGGVNLVLDLDEGVQDHRAAALEVDGVLLQEGLGHLVWVVAVDPELLRGGHGCTGSGTGTETRGPDCRHSARGEARPEAHRRGQHLTTGALLAQNVT